ncbi:DnaT-like ssDNA-binding domain-containing protein [Teredinibacter purpureus]|uniref:DnaT-like ssDNA-binding domain-containing protein n=1 Tax=Teredinibacter purpureus TaxID=2731756 RepID=UPI0005F85396|nr:DnaT-like ssDNA-binding domain-containing protein [Teredinibacter purpureus]
MTSRLIPEHPILVYPSLASKLGLEESILLSVLAELAGHAPSEVKGQFEWRNLASNRLQSVVPFWNDRDLKRICHSLHAKGVLLLGANSLSPDHPFRYAFNERALYVGQPNTASRPTPAPHNTPVLASPSNNFIAANWQPDPVTFAQLAQHNIPENFARDQIPEFVTYWRERGESHRSWGAKFIQHVIRQWRQFEAQRNRQDQNSIMDNQWRPSLDAMEVLTVHASIKREFVEDAIPEFIVYWQERGDAHKTWNSKFIQHVRIQWKKFNTALEHSTDPKLLPSHWQPSEDVYDVLRLANIDVNFATGLIPEFILYWRDSNQVHTSWNTRFLQHAKREWARQHALANQTNNNEQRSTRDITLEEELADRSWAN